MGQSGLLQDNKEKYRQKDIKTEKEREVAMQELCVTVCVCGGGCGFDRGKCCIILLFAGVSLPLPISTS